MFLNSDTQVTDGKPGGLNRAIRRLVWWVPNWFIGWAASERAESSGATVRLNYGRLDDPDKPEYNYVKERDYISEPRFSYPTICGNRSAVSTTGLRRTVKIPTLLSEVNKAGE